MENSLPTNFGEQPVSDPAEKQPKRIRRSDQLIGLAAVKQPAPDRGPKPTIAQLKARFAQELRDKEASNKHSFAPKMTPR